MTKKNDLRVFLALATTAALFGCTLVHPPEMPAPSGHLTRGRTVTAESKDNLYTLAQRYGVKLNELVAVNDLTPPYRVKPGQTIFLPGKAGEAPTPSAAPFGRVERFRTEGAPSPATAASSSLSATEPNVTSAPLEPLLLEKPAATPPQQNSPSAAVTTPAQNAAPIISTESPANVPASGSPQTQTQPTAILPDTTTGTPAFGWPVRGTILSAFGPKSKGQDNDGVNIAAPKGAPVTAAEGGTVVYTDNKMKGFGNLVLLRHQGGWVTAYAHLGRIVVKPDDIVAKGDMIGTVGATGGVSSPQLHFETRRDGKPVDPELVLKQ